jgi:hypothetical protein
MAERKGGEGWTPVDAEIDDEDNINVEENDLAFYVQIHLERRRGQEAREYKDAIKKAVDKGRTELSWQPKWRKCSLDSSPLTILDCKQEN